MKLTAGGESYMQPLMVRMAQGAVFSQGVFAAQMKLADQVTAQQTWVAAARREVGQMRSQLAKVGTPEAQAGMEAPDATVVAGIAKATAMVNAELAKWAALLRQIAAVVHP